MSEKGIRRHKHLGKYENGLEIDKFLHETVEGHVLDEAGDVQERGMWAGLVVTSPALLINMERQHSLTVDERGFLWDQAGAIITEDSNGFVSVTWYHDGAQMAETWSKLARALEEPEDDEYEDDE